MSEPKKSSQTLAVLKHLRRNKKKGITSMEAFNLYGITRLSARIFALRLRGYEIECITETTTNRYGNPCRYGRYVLISEPKNEN